MQSVFETIGLASDLIILLLVFFAVTLSVGAVCWYFLSRTNVDQRLSMLTPTDNPGVDRKEKKVLIESDQKSGLLDRLFSPLHRFALPSEEAMQRHIRLKLIQAGFRSKRSFRMFLGSKVFLTLLFPGLYLLTTLVITFNTQKVLILVLFAVIGLYLPNLVVSFLVRARKSRILRALPDALDLMVICVEAGLGLDMTFKRVGDEMRPLCIDISDEFYLVNREVRAGKSREEAFQHMARRTGVSEMHNLMTVLTQTSRFGTSVAKALRVHSDAMRVRRRQAAEERAAKSAVKLVFPLVAFIFPAILVVLVGPAALQVMRSLLPALGGGG